MKYLKQYNESRHSDFERMFKAYPELVDVYDLLVEFIDLEFEISMSKIGPPINIRCENTDAKNIDISEFLKESSIFIKRMDSIGYDIVVRDVKCSRESQYFNFSFISKDIDGASNRFVIKK